MSAKVILVWFRNDLRTHDNEVLLNAIQKSDFIIPVYIFDPRYYAKNQYNFLNTGAIRQEFILNSVFSLKQKLQSLGGDLLTYEGYPEEIIPHLAQKYDVDEVYHHREVAKRETSISEAVEEALWNIKINLKHFIGHTLYHKEDLPFPIRDIPNDFNTFKKKISKESSVRASFPEITTIRIPPHLEKTNLPNGFISHDNLTGEEIAFSTLEAIISNAKSETDLYCYISKFISIGSLSPVYTYHLLNRYINKTNKKAINSLLDNLLIRDYFRFMLKKYPNSVFINHSKSYSIDNVLIEKWITGKTDNEVVNNIMYRLNNSGVLNEQEQTYTATYFIYELKQNWLIGAAYFEQQLIDYAPATIYGQWSHYADQGTNIKNNKTEEDWYKLKEQNLAIAELICN
ncbi:deoxyribodipyrimidine photo-lyase [Sphingobacterium rhinopitheci]|uniref:deoxyribodipyrimidine photo-lyase n=1 Tax=Sphingobacterium rhinopitheci TaxID=2781960 RepID=UPI001F523715|nr:deoxyribodipyrimidine photo-lyase [Sphingobacterium rhinopitheci]MCI0921373.1 deoxyribodipyrimidine photo-lyase [Sphingobacterium rhinopitheci]